MNKTSIAALAAIGGIAVSSLAGCNMTASETTPTPEKEVLFSRLAIEDMITRYYENFGKTDAAEDFATFYTEDAVFDVNGIVSNGPKAIAAFYTDTGDDEEAPARQGTFHMLISNPVIDIDGDTATAKFTWTGVINTDVKAAPALLEQGREYDLLVRQDGKWRIKKRTVIADSGLPERYAATYQPRVDYDVTKD